MGYLVAAGPAVAKGRPVDVRVALLPALAGSVTPDAIDKSLQFFELAEHSRSLGHSLIFLVAIAAIWKLLEGRRISWAQPFGWFVAGVASHFFIDLLNDAFRGFEGRGFVFTGWPIWPVADHRSIQIVLEFTTRIHPRYTSLEIALFALVAAVMLASRHHHRGLARLR